MSLPLLLVTRSLPEPFRTRIRRLVRGRFRLVVRPQGTERIPAGRAEDIRVVCGWIPPRRLPELVNLGWIHIPWTGVDALLVSGNLPPAALLTCTKGHLSEAIAEHILAGILHISRSFGPFAAASRRGVWLRGTEVSLLKGSPILILGTGHIGRATARLLKSLGVKVSGLNSNGRSLSGFARIFSRKTLKGHLKDFAFVVNTLPYTPDTDGFCGVSFFRSLKKGAGFVNIGRGGTVDEAALADAVESGRLKGAVLDVARREPLPKTSPLYYSERILITAHCAAAPWQNDAEGLEVFCRNLRRFLKNDTKKMEFLVDRKKGY